MDLAGSAFGAMGWVVIEGTIITGSFGTYYFRTDFFGADYFGAGSFGADSFRNVGVIEIVGDYRSTVSSK